MAQDDIIFKMGMDSTEFNRGLQRAKVEAKSFAQGLKSANSMLGGVGLGLGAAAVLSAGKALADWSDELQRLAETTGTTTGEVQAFQFAAAQNGESVKMAGAALDKMNKTVGEARDGNEAAAATFARLGIALKDTSGAAIPTGEILNSVSAKLAAISDPAQRAAMATDLFGKAGVRLIPALLSVNGGLKEMEAELARSGLIMLPENILAVNELKDGLDLLGVAAKASAGNFIGDLVRAVTVVSEKLQEFTGHALGARDALNIFGMAAETSSAPTQVFALFRKLVGSIAGLQKETGPGANRGLAMLDPAQAKAFEAALKKLEETRRKIAFETAEDEGKLAILQEEMLDLQTKLLSAANGTAAAANLEAQLLEKQNSARRIGEAIGKRQLEDAEKRADAEKNVGAWLLGRANQMRALEGRVAGVEASRGERTKYTLAELAGANLRGISDPKLRKDILAAREAVRLAGDKDVDGLAQAAMKRGDRALAERYFSQADKIKSGIGSLKQSELSTIANEITSVNKEVKAWNENAEKGWKIREIVFAK